MKNVTINLKFKEKKVILFKFFQFFSYIYKHNKIIPFLFLHLGSCLIFFASSKFVKIFLISPRIAFFC